MKCEVCEKENPSFAWTDTHGIAQCLQCGTPYVLYHYEGEGGERRRIEKEPEIAIHAQWVPLLREYWGQMHRIIPGGHSFLGGRDLATEADVEAFSDWICANKDKVKECAGQTETKGMPTRETK